MGFTKKDLKNGDIVTYRDGKKRIVLNNELYADIKGIYNTDSCNRLNNYRDDLLDEFNDNDLDIVKVERVNSYVTIFERKEILDNEEKEYLRAVIRPFRKRVTSITKVCWGNRKYIKIFLGYDKACLPDFEKNTMYKGMQANTEYTLEELGL